MKLFKIKFEKTTTDFNIKGTSKKALDVSGKALKKSGVIAGKGLSFLAKHAGKLAERLDKKGGESK